MSDTLLHELSVYVDELIAGVQGETLEAMRDRVGRLNDLRARLGVCVEVLTDASDNAQQVVHERARADLNVRALGSVPGPPNGYAPGKITLERVRDAVVKLRHFTLSELAAELGCSTRRAGEQVKRVAALVRPDGHLGKAQCYEYIEPDGPGEQFEAQQERRAVDLSVSDMALAGGQLARSSKLAMIADKELRSAVKRAIADGWTLAYSGGRHPMRLERKGCRPVTIVSTPRSAGNAVKDLRRVLAARQEDAA